MKLPRIVEVGRLRFQPLRYPDYFEAHPDEPRELVRIARCYRCLIAKRLDTGEEVLLWKCGDINWLISRHDPQASKHNLDAWGELESTRHLG